MSANKSKRLLQKQDRKNQEKLMRTCSNILSNFSDYYYVPSNYQQFRAIILSYMHNLSVKGFSSSEHLMEEIKSLVSYCSKSKNMDRMSQFNINQILSFLQKENCLTLTKLALGTRMVTFINSINKQKIKQLYQQYKQELPSKVNFNKTGTMAGASKLSNVNLMENTSVLEEVLKKKYQEELHLKTIKNLNLSAQQVNLLNQAKQEFKGSTFCQYVFQEKCPNCLKKTCIYEHLVQKVKTQSSMPICRRAFDCKEVDCKLKHFELVSQRLRMIVDRQMQERKNYTKQWINCDLKLLDMNVLGHFDVVMADPPWDIHMTLPYATMKDKQMKNLKIQSLQREGVIFLWVTGRAMQLGRECLHKWGYKRVQQIIWLKVNQGQIIKTGRTGHWLNHTKEHCLVGLKGEPKINKNIDCDVIVAKVRETSRKPDEIYGIIQRLLPGGRKIQLFGRPHNIRQGWLTLGNQLPGSFIEQPQLLENYKKAYPYQNLSAEQMKVNKNNLETGVSNESIYKNHIIIK